MAYIFKLDTVSPDGDNHAAYVQLVDAAAPDKVIANICVPYASDDVKFAADLESKMKAAIAKLELNKSVSTKIASVISAIDPAKITSDAIKILTPIIKE